MLFKYYFKIVNKNNNQDFLYITTWNIYLAYNRNE